MLDDFIIRALLAGIGVALVGGVLGCFIVWRRMAYFGDSLAHSSLLGIGLGLLYGISLTITTIVTVTLFALLLVWLQQQKNLTTDTLLGILAHSALAIGIVTISLLNYQTDLHSYLFGDILAVNINHLLWIYAISTVVLILIYRYWHSLVLVVIDENLAQAEGVNIQRLNLMLTLIIAGVVAVSIQVVGTLLITSLMIIPAASARQLTKTPEQMALFSSLIAVIAVIFGLFGSVLFDTPSGPSIVVAATLIFTLLMPISILLNRLKKISS